MIQNTKNKYLENHTLAAIIGTGVTEGQSFALCHEWRQEHTVCLLTLRWVFIRQPTFFVC